MIYCAIFFTDFRKDISTNQSAKKTLKISYAYKIIAMIITLIVMSGNVILIWDAIDYHRQKNFFEQYGNYSYIQINSEEFNPDYILNRNIYMQHLETGANISLVDLTSWNLNIEYVFANSGAIDYLKKNIQGFDFSNLEKSVYIFMPEKYATNDEILQDAVELWTSYYIGDEGFQFVEYSSNINIIAISNVGKITSRIKKNPIVIFNNLPAESYNDFWNIGYIANSSMINIGESEWDMFLKDNNLEKEICYLTNSYGNYIYQWEFAQRKMFIGIVLVALLLLIDSMIIDSLLKYEYNVYAKEIILKAITGYPILQKHKKIFTITALSWFIGITASHMLLTVIQPSLRIYALLSGIAIVLIESLFIILYTNKMDNVNIQKVLKGGAL